MQRIVRWLRDLWPVIGIVAGLALVVLAARACSPYTDRRGALVSAPAAVDSGFEPYRCRALVRLDDGRTVEAVAPAVACTPAGRAQLGPLVDVSEYDDPMTDGSTFTITAFRDRPASASRQLREQLDALDRAAGYRTDEPSAKRTKED